MKIESSLFLILLAASSANGQSENDDKYNLLGAKTGEGLKSPKTSKSSKDAKRGTRDSTSDDDGISLKDRFGKLLTYEEALALYSKKEDAFVVSQGLVNFETPGNSIALVDYWRNWGVELTSEEAELVCLTRCDQNEACKVVHTITGGADYPGLKSQHTCAMYNPEFGIDTVFQYQDPGYSNEGAIFTKKSAGVEIPEYKGCNVPNGPKLEKAVECLKCLSPGNEDFCEKNCSTPLTYDFLIYLAPGIGCVAKEGGGAAAVKLCFDCLTRKLTKQFNEIVASICLTDQEYSLIRGDSCGGVCFENVETGLDLKECETALQSALLCAIGSKPEVIDKTVYGGAITSPYTCPDFSVVSDGGTPTIVGPF